MENQPFRSIRLASVLAASLGSIAMGSAQVPDLLNAFDAGGRSLGMGGSIGASSSNPSSALNNPAGLGYAGKAMFSMTFRNLTESKSVWSRNYINPDVTTDGTNGSRALTQMGYVKPMGNNAAIGFNYSVAGFIKDQISGTNLLDGETILKNYQEEIRLKTDLFAVSWGKASSDYRQSFGVGLVVASHNTRNLQQYQLYDNNGTPSDTGDDVFLSNQSLNNSGQRVGFGAVAGLQFNPSADLSYGISVRTPIQLSGGNEVSDYYGRVPGKASFGIAKRLNKGMKASDFIILGAQADWFFGGEDDKLVSRDSSQVAFGFGAEYNYRFKDAYIPLRVGFRNVGKGGSGFQSTSALTFGLGYNPDKQNFGLDFDFGSNSRGGTDMSLSLTYRFK